MSSITFIDKNIITNDVFEKKVIVPKETKSFFSCSVLKDTDIAIAKTFKKTLRDWKDIIFDRLGNCREKFSTKDQKKVQDDLESVSQYKELLGTATEYLNNFINKKQESTVRKILYITKDTHLQAIACVSLTDHLYLNILISAPWNIRLNGEVQEVHKSLYCKGSGTALMLGIYKLAQKFELPKIKLTPLAGSHSFYKNQIGMDEVEAPKESKKESHFELSVKNQVPETLLRNSHGLIQDIDI